MAYVSESKKPTKKYTYTKTTKTIGVVAIASVLVVILVVLLVVNMPKGPTVVEDFSSYPDGGLIREKNGWNDWAEVSTGNFVAATFEGRKCGHYYGVGGAPFCTLNITNVEIKSGMNYNVSFVINVQKEIPIIEIGDSSAVNRLFLGFHGNGYMFTYSNGVLTDIVNSVGNKYNNYEMKNWTTVIVNIVDVSSFNLFINGTKLNNIPIATNNPFSGAISRFSITSWSNPDMYIDDIDINW